MSDPTVGGGGSVPEDLQQLQGAWNVVALEVEGRRMTPEWFAGARIIVTGARFTTIAMGAAYDGVVTLDPSATPPALDLHFESGPEQGQTALGIYQLEGERWTICLGFAGRVRPRAFRTTPGSGHALEVLERGAVATATRFAASVPEPAGGAAPVARTLAEIGGEWELVAAVRDGQPLDPEFAATGRRVVRGNETTITFRGQVFMRGTTTIDPTRSPKTIDYVLTQAPGRGKTQLGIYERDGDSLRICTAPPGRPRPTDFTTRQGDDRTLTLWRPRPV